VTRRLTLAVAASLLLCLATVGLWVRSYLRSDVVILFANARRAWSIQSVRGHLDFTSWTSDEPQQVPGFLQTTRRQRSGAEGWTPLET
jgi:hypothetical protein